MYEIYINENELFYSPELVNWGYSINVANCTIELNKAGSLQFQANGIHNPATLNIKKLSTPVRVVFNGEDVWRGRVLESETDFYKNYTMFCEGELAYLNDVEYPPHDYSESGINVKEYFTLLMNYYNANCTLSRQIQIGTIFLVHTSNRVIYPKNEEYTNILSLITDVLIADVEDEHVILRRQNGINYLDYTDQFPDLDRPIEFGVNLLDYGETVSAADIFTYLIPLGKQDENGNRVDITSVNDGKNYIFTPDGEALYGKIWKSVVFDDIEDPSELRAAAYGELLYSHWLTNSIMVRAIDLSYFGADPEQGRIKVGHMIPITSSFHGINTSMLCRKITLDLLNPDRDEYEFGTEIPGFTEKTINDFKKR